MDELLEELLEELPEPREGQEKRRHALTKDDLKLIARILEHSRHCNMGLTPEEVGTLKKFLSAFDQAAATAGKIIVTAIVTGFLGFLGWAFWHKIAEIKK